MDSERIDALKEVINIGVGRAGSVLSELVGTRVSLEIPNLGICKASELMSHLELGGQETVSAVRQSFEGFLGGKALLIFPGKSGDVLATQLVGSEEEIVDLNLEREGVLLEVGNILMNSVIGTLSNVLTKQFRYTLPVYREGKMDVVLDPWFESVGRKNESAEVIYANAVFGIDKFSISGMILLLFEMKSFDRLWIALDEMVVSAAG